MRSGEMRRWLSIAGVMILGGCAGSPDGGDGGNGLEFILASEATAWKPIASDYSKAQEGDVGFKTEIKTQSTANAGNVEGIYQWGENVSDDLFIGLWRVVDGLESRPYKFNIEIELATPAESECLVGGASSVTLKAGLLSTEPQTKLESLQGVADYVVPTFDKGDAGFPGATVAALGNLLNEQPGCSGTGTWATFKRTTKEPITITPQNGVLYLLVGGDSAFEVPTVYLLIRAKLSEVK